MIKIYNHIWNMDISGCHQKPFIEALCTQFHFADYELSNNPEYQYDSEYKKNELALVFTKESNGIQINVTVNIHITANAEKKLEINWDENNFDSYLSALIHIRNRLAEIDEPINIRQRCFKHFIKTRTTKEVDCEYLSLQLAYYLSLQGMYNKNSFLIEKDYKIHIPAIEEILKPQYNALCGVSFSRSEDIMEKLYSHLLEYYQDVYCQVKGNKKGKVPEKLVKQILMGTMGVKGLQ